MGMGRVGAVGEQVGSIIAILLCQVIVTCNN